MVIMWLYGLLAFTSGYYKAKLSSNSETEKQYT